jgi:hypothetical protein
MQWDRGATLPERRQSSCALKLQRTKGFVQLRVKRSNIVPSVDRYNETVALLPSFLQRRPSIDTMNNPGWVDMDVSEILQCLAGMVAGSPWRHDENSTLAENF